MIAQQLDKCLVDAIASGGSEPDVVRRFVAAAQSIRNTPAEKVRAAFIHQRPYVFFVQPLSIAGRQACKFGDILYVFKKLDSAGTLVQANAVFLQAKKGIDHWLVEPHQLEFLWNIDRIQFRFGNSVYKHGGYAPIIYNGLRTQGDIAQYVLIGAAGTLSYSVGRVAAKQRLYQHAFSISDASPINCAEADVPLCHNHDAHLQFLERFCSGSEGAELSGDLRQIVELIYKRIGWQLDPPEEFADNFVEDNRGFAVVEVTSSPEEWRRDRESSVTL